MPDGLRTALVPLAEARAAWEDLRQRSPQATATAHPAFAEAVGAVNGWPAHVAGVWEGERLRAGAVVYTRRWGPYRAAALPPLVVPSPLLLEPSRSEGAALARRSPLDALLALLAEGFHQVSLVLHPSLTDVRPLTWAGWRVHPAYTYHMPLAPGQAPADGWSGSARRRLRHHEGTYTVEAGASIEEVMRLVEASHARQRQPFDGQGARRLAERAFAAGLVEPFVARRGGTAEAGALALHDGRTAHHWLAGSLPGPSMTVLLARAAEQLRDRGISTYDLAGANTPTIAEFKRKFGRELVPYFRARLVTRPELRALDGLLARF